jgi:type I restriction enzyme S subunit
MGWGMSEGDLELRLLGDVADTNPVVLPANTPANTKFRYVDLSAVETGFIDWGSVAEVTYATAPSRARRVVQPKDILFGTVRPNLQSHGFVGAEQTGHLVASTGFSVVRARNGLSCSSYLFHSLMSSAVTGQAVRNAVGSSYPALNDSDVNRFEIFLPPFREQEQIALILDTLDTAIHETEAIIAKLKAVKQGLLHDLLTRGIDANGELRPPQAEAPHLYKESPLGWIPNKWSIQLLGDIAAVGRGKFTHRPRNDPRFYGGIHPFIQTGDVAAAEGELVSTYSQTLSDRGVSASQEFPAGTIAITIAANIADTAILAMPMYFPDSVVGAIVGPQHNVRFVELSIRKAKRLLDARAPQSAQKNINLQDLRPLPMALPSKPEQEEIATRYEAIQAKLEYEQEALAKCRMEKAGLMDDLLTGRVRVTPLLEGVTP